MLSYLPICPSVLMSICMPICPSTNASPPTMLSYSDARPWVIAISISICIPISIRISISIYLSIYIYIYVYIYIYLYVYAYLYLYVYPYLYLYVYLYLYLYVYLYLYLDISISLPSFILCCYVPTSFFMLLPFPIHQPFSACSLQLYAGLGVGSRSCSQRTNP